MNIRVQIRDIANLPNEIIPNTTDIRRELHINPGVAYEESYANMVLTRELTRYGHVFESGWGKHPEKGGGHGIVVTIPGIRTDSGETIALRSDMDALKMAEAIKDNVMWHSQVPGTMHGCGHDGHMATLLTIARYYADPANRKFNGTLKLIFQPAEEAAGGAKRMIQEGLFTKHPITRMYAIHNWPTLELGQIAVHPSRIMAASDYFEVAVKGRGGHAAQPENVVNPMRMAMRMLNELDNELTTYNSPTSLMEFTNADQFGSKSARAVIADTFTFRGTVRAYKRAKRQEAHDILARLSQKFNADLKYDRGTAATINTPREAELAAAAARDVVGASNVHIDLPPGRTAEDFGEYGEHGIKIAFAWVGQGNLQSSLHPHSQGLHTKGYDFNDALIPIGAEYMVRIVERELALES